MLRKSLLAASIAMLALGAGKAALAVPVFLEPYGELNSARTFLSSPADARPKDALQAQGGGEGARSSSFVISPMFRMTSIPLGGADLDVMMFGGTLGYASVANPAHPWSLQATLFNANFDIGGADTNEFGFDISGKYVIWQGANSNTPVVSLVGRYLDIDAFGRRFDVLLAADQRLMDNAYATVNVGYANLDFDGGGNVDDFRAGVGLTYVFSPKLSISGNYIIKNDVDVLSGIGGADTWSISGTYAFTDQASLRVGGGKHETFFANLNWRWK